MKLELPRTSSCNSSTTTKIIPTTYMRSTSYKPDPNHHTTNTNTSVVFHRQSKPRLVISAFFRSLINLISFPMILPTCRWLTIPSHLSITPTLGRKVTGTLFGNRRGHVSFAVQYDPRSAPVLIIELEVSTSTLVKEMSSGLVRIALECSKGPTTRRHGKLWKEPMWTMYCNGRKSGYALSRECTQSDWHVLSTVESVSVGAGVIPVVEDGRKGGMSEGELLYMRARFERVVGTQHSEAYYMMNPDGNGGPDLSIFLLRV
ncbi:Protein MIZU-KUSSEI [Heracleum sosnowskyi]|uniref:Protein MIZU-KUSSEI n=1 Tax=Heracleum sosnowskyi TaxID=360622 RepID=A0AAD8HEU4_9APIA|nr:Protein MIZU-KUSSEI [Heracleum sosnowskyi]